MLSAALLVIAAVQLGSAVAVGRVRGEGAMRRWLLRVVALGLAYDAAVFGLGAVVGEGEVLRDASFGRFLAHAVLTPLLVPWAAALSGRNRRDAWAVVVVLIGWGVLVELRHLELVPRTFADTLRYAPADPTAPIPALIVMVVLLAAGVRAWRRRRWPWLALGAGAMFAAAAGGTVIPPLGNAGEAVLLAALVCTERWFVDPEFEPPRPGRAGIFPRFGRRA
ncbi:hypothetical protein NDR87_00430 [Nocardia sp. CDC159]|uniref:Uncharacterized protein n=1 Tax=Nocardia pulmonis TaxID=2951408 RepID=A0A9X2IUU7_9NOCA|nr:MULTISPECIES: hypothetical protein [Nocardia]MCM6772523.1 hypothetical protein [Nocardia pulmonis]MCM6784819.1 hypothetical protein [Nocardia sp. CDC159]